MDHLTEDKSYYIKLSKMEKQPVNKSRFVRPHYRKKEQKVRGYSSPKELETMDKDHVYEMAKSAADAGEWDEFRVCKDELERRVFMQKAQESLADLQAVDGKRPIDRDKKVFEDMHGATSSSSSDSSSDEHGAEPTEDKRIPPLGGAAPEGGSTEKALLLRDLRKVIKAEIKREMSKAILTKPSEKREKPKKKTKANPKAKVGSNTKGKTYQYPDKDKKAPGAPEGSEGPQKASSKPAPALPPAKLNPERLAKLMGTPVAALAQLALKYDEPKFVSYFNTKAAHLIEKYEIPHSYWQELHHELRSQASQGNNKNQFSIKSDVYEKGSDLRDMSAALQKAGVHNLGLLERFLVKHYALSRSAASKGARELFKALHKDGAIITR